MLKWTRRSRVSSALFVAACVCTANAQDARLSVFERYNHAAAYDEIRPILSGLLAQQYASIASRDPQRVPQILAQQQLTSYRSRIVEIDDTTSFLVLDDVTFRVSRDRTPQAYLMSRSGGMWTLANRMLVDSVIKTLWTAHFAPADFVQPSSCSIDGREIDTKSVLAIRQGDTIQIKLYPFTFSPADLEYWRSASGIAVADSATAGSHFDEPFPAVCRLVVKVDAANRLSLLNVGFDDRTTSSLWQPSPADVSTLALERETLVVVTAGAIGAATHSFRWNVKIRVPLWQKGL